MWGGKEFHIFGAEIRKAREPNCSLTIDRYKIHEYSREWSVDDEWLTQLTEVSNSEDWWTLRNIRWWTVLFNPPSETRSLSSKIKGNYHTHYVRRPFCFTAVVCRVAQKNWHNFLYALTLPNINRFSKFFHCQNQEKICNNAVTKDPTTPQLCRYTTLCPTKAPRRGVLPSRQRPAF